MPLDLEMNTIKSDADDSHEVDDSPLLRKNDGCLQDDEQGKKPRQLWYRFVFMSLYFSTCMGTVTTLTAVASALLGPKIGAYNLATLYGNMVLSSLLVSSWAVKRFGPKRCLVGGMLAMSMYVLSFAVAVTQREYAWPAVLLGAAVGGWGAGILWTGQGVYFARCSQEYASQKMIKLEGATNTLGSVFATMFLGFEVILKVASSPILSSFGPQSLFEVYSVIALGSTLAMCTIIDMPTTGTSLLDLTTPRGTTAERGAYNRVTTNIGGVDRKKTTSMADVLQLLLTSR
jgi:hypothetical protein